MKDTWDELRLAARNLAHRPGFTLVAAITLALGIGASVAVFAVVHGVLIEPLPFPESHRLVEVLHRAPGVEIPEVPNSSATYRFYTERARSFGSFGLVDEQGRNLTGTDRPARVTVASLTPSMFRVLRTEPFLGRSFTDDDAEPGAPPVAVLTHREWTSRFGADPQVLGRTIRLDDGPTEIVGVMPAGFHYPSPETSMLLPFSVDPEEIWGSFGPAGIARLAEGVELAAAEEEIAALQGQLHETFPNASPELLEQIGWSVDLVPLKERIVGDIESSLWIVLATVAIVLLIACANVANLVLVRAETRQSEVAIRAALGATRGRLARHFFSESLWLGLLGGVIGVVIAWLGVRLLVAFGPSRLPRLQEVGVDAPVLAFAAVIALVATLLFTLIPVLRYLGRSFGRMLREGGRGATDSRARQRARNGLVVGQLALAMMLLVGSGLMLESFWQLRSVDAGIDAEGVLTVALPLGPGAEDTATAARFYQRVVDEVSVLPGVEAAGAVNVIPLLAQGMNAGSFSIEGRTEEDEIQPIAIRKVASSGYFETMGIPLLAGRSLERADHEEPSAAPVWVNATFARRFLDDDALGHRIRLGEESPWHEIVGVVGDVRELGLDLEVRPTFYFPMRTPGAGVMELDAMFLVARATGDPTGLVPAIRGTVNRIDPDVPLSSIRTMDTVVARSMTHVSFTMVLLGVAAAVAMALGAVGLYGVISYVVGLRSREIGIRMALGAAASDIRRMVLRQGLAVTALGILVGLGGALATSRFMTAILFRVDILDPVVYGAVTLLVVSTALLATWLPARRASSVDPAETLKIE